jgi:hypothetical protein
MLNKELLCVNKCGGGGKGKGGTIPRNALPVTYEDAVKAPSAGHFIQFLLSKIEIKMRIILDLISYSARRYSCVLLEVCQVRSDGSQYSECSKM